MGLVRLDDHSPQLLGAGGQRERVQIAIAYVEDPTTTQTTVSRLAALGYTDIRGVHCRETIGGSSEPTRFGDAVEITHAKLIQDGWQDGSGPIDADTELGEGEFLVGPGNAYYVVKSVVTPKTAYTVAPHAG